MAQQLVTYSGDRRIVLSNGEAKRSPIFGSDWNHIRVGIQGAFINATGDIIGTPRLAFGVCHGLINGYGASSSDHVIGIRTNNTKLLGSYQAGPPAFFGANIAWNIAWEAFKRVGSTVTTGAFSGIGSPGPCLSATSSVRSAVFLDITKGSPYAFRIGTLGGGASAVLEDVTDDLFSQAMEMADLSTIGTAIPHYIDSGEIAPSLSIDEGTDGDLDSIFVFWDRESQNYSFNIDVKKLS